MKKIIVIGCPGSGKSTFSRELHKKLDIPLYHLDMIFWNTDKTTVGKEIFLERLSEILKKDEWIIDGNYASTLKMRADACDAIFFLDYPKDVCLDGIRKRRGQVRSDIPWVESEEDEEFTDFVKGFAERQRPGILELIDRCSDKEVIVFKTREEAADFLREK